MNQKRLLLFLMISILVFGMIIVPMITVFQNSSIYYQNFKLETADPPKQGSDFVVVPFHVHYVEGMTKPTYAEIKKKVTELNNLYHVHHIVFAWDGQIRMVKDPRPPAVDGMKPGDINSDNGTELQAVQNEARRNCPNGVNIIIPHGLKSENATHYWTSASGISYLGSNAGFVSPFSPVDTWAHELLHGIGRLSHGSEKTNPTPPPPSGWDANKDGKIDEDDRRYMLWGRDSGTGSTTRTGNALTESQHVTMKEMAKKIPGVSLKKYYVITPMGNVPIKNVTFLNDTQNATMYNKTHIYFGYDKHSYIIDIIKSTLNFLFLIQNIDMPNLHRFELKLTLNVDNLTHFPTTGNWPVNFTAGYYIDYDGLVSGCTNYPYAYPGLFQPDLKIAVATDNIGNPQLVVQKWLGSWTDINPILDVSYEVENNDTVDPSPNATISDVYGKFGGLLEGQKDIGLQVERKANQTSILFNFSLSDFPNLNQSIFEGNPIKITP
ncbi:MAG: hypothetical protein ACTSX4_03500, partial [Candidatus Helarchaeota archaeon]